MMNKCLPFAEMIFVNFIDEAFMIGNIIDKVPAISCGGAFTYEVGSDMTSIIKH